MVAQKSNDRGGGARKTTRIGRTLDVSNYPPYHNTAAGHGPTRQTPPHETNRTKKGGCWTCGSEDHYARNCDQGRPQTGFPRQVRSGKIGSRGMFPMPRDHKKAEKTPLIKSSVGANRKTGQKWPKGRKEERKSPFESQRKETKGSAWSTACHNYWSGGNGETSEKMAFTMHPLTRKRGGGVDTNNSSSPRPTTETDRCDLLGTRRDTGNAGARECKSEGEQQDPSVPRLSLV